MCMHHSAGYPLLDFKLTPALSSAVRCLPPTRVPPTLACPALPPPQVGRLWTSLADYFIRRGMFERARDVYEEGLTSVVTVRDFSLVYDALTQVGGAGGLGLGVCGGLLRLQGSWGLVWGSGELGRRGHTLGCHCLDLWGPTLLSAHPPSTPPIFAPLPPCSLRSR